jgi:hypothetical protein
MKTNFTPDGDWFVFNPETGATIRRGLRSKLNAKRWIARELAKTRAPAREQLET